MPFDEDFEDISKLKMIGKNNNSRFNKPIDNNFEEKAKKIESDKNSYKRKIGALASQLKNILNDKTLISNKSELDKIVEDDVLKEMLDLASKINSDQSEAEGTGSILLSAILLKMMLAYRDRANVLSYKLECLEKEMKEFPKLVENRIERINKKE